LALLDILDTAGQDEYSAMRDQYMRTGQGFMLVFDITSRVTFDNLAAFAEQISRVKDANLNGGVPLVVVGNKADLEMQRAVTSGEASAWAASIGAAYIETSARTRVNVDECFHQLVREIRRVERPAAAASKAQPIGVASRSAARASKPSRSFKQRLLRLLGKGKRAHA
jgi:GTPase KRas protein